MQRNVLQWVVLTGALLAPATGFAQVACTRAGLQAAADLYIAAQTKGGTAGMPLAMGVAYIENMAVKDIATGVIQKPLKIDLKRTFIDPATCQSFTEVIVTDKADPHVIGTRLRVNKDKIVEIESLVTNTGDWLFNADNYLKWSSSEDWGVIPAARRDSRETLIQAANAYLDAFLEKNLDPVPWGEPCNRTEGGAHTGNGSPNDSCTVGVPEGVNIVGRRFIVDETVGVVTAFCTFGINGLPDTHTFRLENGKLRFVHTLSAYPDGDPRTAGPNQGKAKAKGKGKG